MFYKTSLAARANTATFHLLENDWQPVLLSPLHAFSRIIASHHVVNEREGEREGGRSADRWRQKELTELEAVDAQARICGVVQPPLLSPAAGGVRVHLPRSTTCATTVILSHRNHELITIFTGKYLKQSKKTTTFN